MAALTNNKLRQWFCGGFGPFPVPVLGGVHIYQGALICVEAGVGLAKPAIEDTGLVALGVAEYEVDATNADDGAMFVHVKPGRWSGFSSATAGDAITAADIANVVYMVDDNTLAKTDGTGTRSPAGTFLGFDDRGKLILSVGGSL